MAVVGPESQVFINCPFDDEYRPLFRAMVFTIYKCGFLPRCAAEVSDSGQNRLDKIMDIIDECGFGPAHYRESWWDQDVAANDITEVFQDAVV